MINYYSLIFNENFLNSISVVLNLRLLKAVCFDVVNVLFFSWFSLIGIKIPSAMFVYRLNKEGNNCRNNISIIIIIVNIKKIYLQN